MKKSKKLENLNQATGEIKEIEPLEPQMKIIPLKRRRQKKDPLDNPMVMAVASERGENMVRRDVAGSIIRTDRFKNIDDGVLPFRYSSSVYGTNRSFLDVRDCVILCQKAYYNDRIFNWRFILSWW